MFIHKDFFVKTRKKDYLFREVSLGSRCYH